MHLTFVLVLQKASADCDSMPPIPRTKAAATRNFCHRVGIVYTGTHNVAATEEHPSIGRWALDTTFHRSVKALANAKPCASTAMAAVSTAKQSQAIS